MNLKRITYLSIIFLLSVSMLHAQVEISGVVKDTEGEALIGATIIEKGTGNGTNTDIDGQFSLSVNGGSVIVVTYVGYEVKEIPIGTENFIEVELVSESELLDDIVVIGYGEKQRKDIVEAISSVGVERLKKRNATLPGEALQGEVSGVQVTTTGRPGDQAIIRLRGYNSISLNNRPLILVDGVEVSRLFSVNPKDIESISVLKDAASQAIYGNRAANGVILITTKSGAFNKKGLTYNVQFGNQEATNQVEQLNAGQYVELINEARVNAGESPIYDASEVAFWQNEEGTNWQDEVLQTGMTQSHNLNFSSSSEAGSMSLSLGYMDEEGIYITTGFQRYNARLKTEFKATERVKVGTNMNFVYTDQNSGGDFYISRAFMMPPTVDVWEEDGRIGYDKANPSATNGILKNPVAMAELIRWRIPQTHFFGSVFTDYEFMPGDDEKGIWSGHSVLDDNGNPYIMYTGVDFVTAQMMVATSPTNDYYNFEKYANNPVVSGPPAPYTTMDFRDPYLWKHEGTWYMIIGSGLGNLGNSGGAVLLFKSSDLYNWTYLEPMKKGFPATDDSGGFWEMPVFLPFGDKWVLLVNPVPTPQKPARMLYWTGTFENEEFTPDYTVPKLLGNLKGMLAPAVFTEESGRTIALGIIPDLLPAEEQRKNGWAHLYSLPREWYLSEDGETLLQNQ